MWTIWDDITEEGKRWWKVVMLWFYVTNVPCSSVLICHRNIEHWTCHCGQLKQETCLPAGGGGGGGGGGGVWLSTLDRQMCVLVWLRECDDVSTRLQPITWQAPATWRQLQAAVHALLLLVRLVSLRRWVEVTLEGLACWDWPFTRWTDQLLSFSALTLLVGSSDL